MTGAFYLGLMLRNSRWVGMPWIAVLLLMSAGVAYNLASVKMVPLMLSFVMLSFGLGNIIWLNLLLCGAVWWRRWGTAVAARLAWYHHDLAKPLLVWPLVGFIVGLLGLAVLDAVALLWVKLATEIVPWSSTAMIGIALTLSCIQRLRLQRSVLAGHVTIASAFCTLLATWLGCAIQINVAVWGFHLPLFLALWCMLLLGFESEWGARWVGIPGLDRTRQPVAWWLVITSPAVLVALVVFPPVSLGELLLILSVFSGVCAYIGWQRRQVAWLFVAMSALVVALHMPWLFWVPLHDMSRLVPVYALQLAGTMWVAGWLRSRVEHSECRQALNGQQLLLATLALGTWIWHACQGLMSLMGLTAPREQVEIGEALIAMAAPLLLIAFGAQQVRRTQRAA